MFGYTLIKIILNTLGEDNYRLSNPLTMYVYMVDNELCVIMSLGELIVEAGIRCPVVVRRQHLLWSHEADSCHISYRQWGGGGGGAGRGA